MYKIQLLVLQTDGYIQYFVIYPIVINVVDDTAAHSKAKSFADSTILAEQTIILPIADMIRA